MPFLRRNFGLMFQDHKLLFDRNAFDNVMLPLAITGFERREAARRVRAALDKVGLLAKEKACRSRCPAASSSGSRIARAIVHRPAILLADEPTGNLDAAYAAEHRRAVPVVQPGRRDGGDRDPRRSSSRRACSRACIALRRRQDRGMKTWLRHQLDACAATLARLARTPVAALLNVGVIGIALALPVGLYVALVNLQGFARTLASDPQIVGVPRAGCRAGRCREDRGAPETACRPCAKCASCRASRR